MTARSQIATSFLERTVPDERLRRALTPDYPFRCKRVLLGDDYYRALQQDNVELVTDPIDRITETSVVTAAGGSSTSMRIVLATGFETSRYLSGIDVVGVGGQSLHDRWGADPSAYLGVGGQRIPELLHALRPEHQPGRQLDRLHPGGRRAPGGQRREPGWHAEAATSTSAPRPKSVTTTAFR